MPLRQFRKPVLFLVFLAGFMAHPACAQNCTFAFTPTSASVAAQGGAGFFDLTAASGNCTRTAASTVDWITISFGQTGTGNGRVGYTVKPNTLGQPRQGSIVVSGQSFIITQESAVCTFTFTPASQSVSAAGGAFTIKVATSCTWTATSSDPWITIGSPGVTGNGDLSFTVAPNTAASSRSGAITLGSQKIAISQAGAGCVVTLSITSIPVLAAGQTGTFGITVNYGCTVTAVPDASWITASVSGSNVSYAVAANPSTQPRSGSILIGSQNVAINQAGAACTYSISPVTVAIPASGSSGTISVTTGQGCPWTVQSNAAFITNLTATSLGPGSVSFSVGPNLANMGRAGTLIIAGLTATVSQAAATVQISPGGIVNGASFMSGPVSPGEIVSIFGSTLGPVVPAPLQLSSDGQSLTTALAGTRVLFDGVAAPMILASAGQVNAIVPYEIAGNATTKVQVEYQGVNSDPVVMSVAPSAPGIFTLDQSGKGQGAVLNQDFSANGPANPAPPGSILMVYATGEGQTDPAGIDGKLTGKALPMPVQPVAVQIGGKDAEVLYAGGAPGLVAGLLQVNVRVPAGVSGSALPVLLRIGSAVSPGDVTVAIQ